MEMLNAVNGITYKFVTDNKKNAAGKVKVYLRFYSSNGNKIKDQNIGVHWPRDFFDSEKECVLPRFEKDPDEKLTNLKINHLRSILHRLDAEAYLTGRNNSLQDYLNALSNYSTNVNFTTFVHTNNNYEYNKDIIQYPTWRRHRSSLNRLIEFWGSDYIPLNHITTDKIREFDAYWKTKKKKRNTITGYHKDIKKHLNTAVEKKLIKKNPYDNFGFGYVDGDREALSQDELKKLFKMYSNPKLKENIKEILRRFLFSCLTGLRISDTHVVKRSMIRNNVLVFTPVKGNVYGKIIKLPLPEAARDLIEGRDGLLFDKVSDKHINFMLKIIGGISGIEKNLTYHCARDTFGTIFVELGGDIKTLKELMGHSNIKTTEIYLKMSDKRKVSLMNNFDQLFK